MAARFMSFSEARDLFIAQFSNQELWDLALFLQSQGHAVQGMNRLLEGHFYPGKVAAARSLFFAVNYFKVFNQILFGTPHLNSALFSTGIHYDYYPIIKEIPRLKQMVKEWLVTPRPIAATPMPEPSLPPPEEKRIRLDLSIPPAQKAAIAKVEREKRAAAKPRQAQPIAWPIIGTRSCFLAVAWNKLTGEATIVDHAWSRWLERFHGVPRSEAETLPYSEDRLVRFQQSFCGATRINLPPDKEFRRLLNNGVQEAIYLRNKEDRLVFVVPNDRPYRIITVEPAKISRQERRLRAVPRRPDWFERYLQNRKEGITD